MKPGEIFIRYKDLRFNQATLDTMGQANAVIDQYRKAGHDLTLRQLYYRMVATGLLKTNTKQQYERLGDIMTNGRLAGLVSWDALEDRGRNLMGLNTETDIGSAIKKMRRKYKLDLWEDQPCRVEVWVEKQSLEKVLGGICNKLRVDFFATKGYNSVTEMWNAGQRFGRYVTRGQRPIVLHVADHDPAGMDMTRDAEERLSLFAGVPIPVRRIALNMDQVEHYNPPPNYAKEEDSKTPAYVAQYGEKCWEVDALDPATLQDIIEKEVMRWREPNLWEKAVDREAEDLAELDVIVEEHSPEGGATEDVEEDE